MVYRHGKDSTNETKVVKMMLIAKTRVWIYLKCVVVTEEEGGEGGEGGGEGGRGERGGGEGGGGRGGGGGGKGGGREGGGEGGGGEEED